MSQSNRTLLTIAHQTLAQVDQQLSEAEQRVPSTAWLRVGRARSYLRAASEEIASALDQQTDPLLDLSRGATS